MFPIFIRFFPNTINFPRFSSISASPPYIQYISTHMIILHKYTAYNSYKDKISCIAGGFIHERFTIWHCKTSP